MVCDQLAMTASSQSSHLAGVVILALAIVPAVAASASLLVLFPVAVLVVIVPLRMAVQATSSGLDGAANRLLYTNSIPAALASASRQCTV